MLSACWQIHIAFWHDYLTCWQSWENIICIYRPIHLAAKICNAHNLQPCHHFVTFMFFFLIITYIYICPLNLLIRCLPWPRYLLRRHHCWSLHLVRTANLGSKHATDRKQRLQLTTTTNSLADVFRSWIRALCSRQFNMRESIDNKKCKYYYSVIWLFIKIHK